MSNGETDGRALSVEIFMESCCLMTVVSIC